MTTDPIDTRPPHAPDVGFITRGGLVAFCRCGAVQIVDPERECHARTWLRAAGWSRPPTNLADPNDGWFCPTCTTPHDTRTAAHRLTVTPETLRRAEALGFEPGSGDVLLWALREIDRLQFAVAEFKQWSQAGPNGCPPYSSSLAGYLRQLDASFAALRDIEDRIRESRNTAWAERDAARHDLARIVQLCGWDCDGNDPESPSGAVHLYGDAVQAVRELVEERAEDSREIVLLHRLCSEAADMLDRLDEPSPAVGDAMVELADRLRAAADEKPPRPICGAVVRERVTGTMTARTLCPLPPGHDGYHAEALAGDDTDTDRSAP